MIIHLDRRFNEPLNSMLVIAIEGDPQSICAALQDICRSLSDKPAQGTYVNSDHTTQIITPVWNGKKY